MSTRIRYIAVVNGGYYTGHSLRKSLGIWAKELGITIPKDVPASKKWIFLFEEIKKAYRASDLWVFREPRNANPKYSRYIKACKQLGIGRIIRSRERIRVVGTNPNVQRTEQRPARPRRESPGRADRVPETGIRFTLQTTPSRFLGQAAGGVQLGGEAANPDLTAFQEFTQNLRTARERIRVAETQEPEFTWDPPPLEEFPG